MIHAIVRTIKKKEERKRQKEYFIQIINAGIEILEKYLSGHLDKYFS